MIAAAVKFRRLEFERTGEGPLKIAVQGLVLISLLAFGNAACTTSPKVAGSESGPGSGSGKETEAAPSCGCGKKISTPLKGPEVRIEPKDCLMKEFRPERFPWKIADCMNYEEVFKDYEYIEGKWNPADSTVTVLKYQQGQVRERVTYQFTPPKSGEKWSYTQK